MSNLQGKYINLLTDEESLKNYRDIKNIVDTSREEGLQEGRQEGRQEREIEIVNNCILSGMADNEIASITGLNIQIIQEIRKTKN